MVRFYSKNNFGNKGNTGLVEKISMFIKLIMNPIEFCNSSLSWIENKTSKNIKKFHRISIEEEKNNFNKMPE